MHLQNILFKVWKLQLLVPTNLCNLEKYFLYFILTLCV